jgi:hypothetical protein
MKIFGDYIFLDEYASSTVLPSEPAAGDPAFIKHVYCWNSRIHVLRWDSNGVHCSENNCIINKRPNRPAPNIIISQVTDYD